MSMASTFYDYLRATMRLDKKLEEPANFHEFMHSLPEHVRYRWCGPDDDNPGCCWGCVNNNDGFVRHGYTASQWLAWVHDNPRDTNKRKKY